MIRGPNLLTCLPTPATSGIAPVFSALREPVPPTLLSISNGDEFSGGGGGAGPGGKNPPVVRERPTTEELRSVYLAGGIARDTARLAAKWAMMGALAAFLPSPWGWIAAAAMMGGIAVFNGTRIAAHFLTENPDRYEIKYDVLMGRLQDAWRDMAALLRDESMPLHERSSRYRELLSAMRSSMKRLEEMNYCDPERVMAGGSLMGFLYLFFAVILVKDDKAPLRYAREARLRDCRKFVNALPKELPALPPEPEESAGYREVPVRLRVEAPKEFVRFEARMKEIDDDADLLEDERSRSARRMRRKSGE